MNTHTWEVPKIYQIWTQNQANRNDWPEEDQKKCPKRVIQTTMRAWFCDSLFEPAHVSIHMYPFFLLIILHGNSFLQSQGARTWPLTTDLFVRIQCSHCPHLNSVSGWEPKTHLKLLQAKSTQGQYCICQFPPLIPSSFSLHVSVLC